MSLELAKCEDVSAAEVRRIAGLELHLPVEPSSTDPTSKLTTVLIECGDDATITLVDTVTGKKLIRQIELGHVAPIARPRLLALSVVELLSASWAELELLPPEVEARQLQASPAVRARALEVVRRERSRRPSTSALAVATARTFRGQWSAWGGGVQVGVDFGAQVGLGLQAHVALEHAAYRASLGTVSIDMASVGAALYLDWRLGAVTLRPGLGVEGGRVAQAGKPFDPQQTEGRSGSGWFVGPTLGVAASLQLSKSWLIQCGPEAGYVVLPVGIYVARQRAIAVEGLWLGASLGVGLAL